LCLLCHRRLTSLPSCPAPCPAPESLPPLPTVIRPSTVVSMRANPGGLAGGQRLRVHGCDGETFGIRVGAYRRSVNLWCMGSRRLRRCLSPSWGSKGRRDGWRAWRGATAMVARHPSRESSELSAVHLKYTRGKKEEGMLFRLITACFFWLPSNARATRLLHGHSGERSDRGECHLVLGWRLANALVDPIFSG